jgi:hypothetical protein
MKQNEIEFPRDEYSPVTYVPSHAKGNANHPDCDRGVLISNIPNERFVRVLFCKNRRIQAVDPKYLVWG